METQEIQILVVGTNQPILATIARLIDKDGKWKATVVTNVKDAVEVSASKMFSLVLIGAGLTDEEELNFKQRFATLNSTIPIVKHYGGGSGLLYAEIYQALGK